MKFILMLIIVLIVLIIIAIHFLLKKPNRTTTLIPTTTLVPTTTLKSCNSILLGFNKTDANLACKSEFTTYDVDGFNFLNSTEIYFINSSCHAFALTGWYSDGIHYRYWDGKLTNPSKCKPCQSVFIDYLGFSSEPNVCTHTPDVACYGDSSSLSETNTLYLLQDCSQYAERGYYSDNNIRRYWGGPTDPYFGSQNPCN